ncbi:MAG TPA: cellulase family glycosylhydrolase [Pyrinomonadaceae bacterium]|nr:cellulase family glycosylhydrolase [Pyrinomonadaceae bacterium]
MKKKLLLIAALILVGSAAVLILAASSPANPAGAARSQFVHQRGGRFLAGNKPFRFVGANIAVMYRDEDRERMPETIRQAAQAGIKVVRVWAYGEGGPNDVKPVGRDAEDWPRHHSFRFAPNQWNEDAFVHLDKVIAEAARNGIYVQLCLTNWWRDTGGVTQYLRWAGINDAADDSYKFGINNEKAVLFYTNPETRRLYREHVEKLATRRNTVTGVLYRDDPSIFAWELMNEAQVITGRWAERRAWFAEMSAYLKSLDPNHMITTGAWGYRSAAERREWLADHALAAIDYCDVHNYPRDDHDSFIESPAALKDFIENRAAAAFSLGKPLVMGEFGMSVDGHQGVSQVDWYKSFFDGSAAAGAGGAMFWILTPDVRRGYGVTYSNSRDEALLREVSRASQVFAALQSADLPAQLQEPERHLVPRQFAWSRSPGEAGLQPQMIVREDRSVLYQFKPQMAVAQRFEKIGGGPGYIWGYGSGFLEYVVPERSDRRRVSEIIVRAHIQPVLPVDAPAGFNKTRVTLFVEDWNAGSRVIPLVSNPAETTVQEWRLSGFLLRLRAMRGLPLSLRFAVTSDSDLPYGINISNWPEGYDSQDHRPIEVELRH